MKSRELASCLTNISRDIDPLKVIGSFVGAHTTQTRVSRPRPDWTVDWQGLACTASVPDASTSWLCSPWVLVFLNFEIVTSFLFLPATCFEKCSVRMARLAMRLTDLSVHYYSCQEAKVMCCRGRKVWGPLSNQRSQIALPTADADRQHEHLLKHLQL